MTEPPFDLTKAHRWFGVECNNAAWEVLEQPSLGVDEAAEAVELAHASQHHWTQVGTELNRLRSEYLLATAYAAAGLGEASVRHAERALSLRSRLETLDLGLTDFDRASSVACAVRALVAADRPSDARERLDEAEALLEALEPDDRSVVEQTFLAPIRGSLGDR